MALAADKTGWDVVEAALEDSRSAARTACTVCVINATISGETPAIAGPAGGRDAWETCDEGGETFWPADEDTFETEASSPDGTGSNTGAVCKLLFLESLFKILKSLIFGEVSL